MSFNSYPGLFMFLINISVVIATSDSPISPPASEVTLTTSSSSIHEGFTKSLSLICSLPRDDKSEISGLKSMIVSKTDDPEDTDFKEIAVISTLSGRVEVKDDLGGGQVDGQLTHGGSAYIAFQWNYPTSQVKGRYQCTVHGMDRLGHPVLSTAVAVIEEKPVDLQMIINKIQGLETTQDQLKSELNHTKAQLISTENNLNITIDVLDVTRANLTYSTFMLNNKIETLDKTRANLTSTINKLNGTATWLLSMLNYTVYNNHYYVMSDLVNVNVPVFQQKCKGLNGYLVEIDNQNEFEMLKEFINRLQMGDYYIYIGMTDEGHKGQWTYLTSGAPVTFTEWYSGEPNSRTSENCAMLYTYNMKMYDHPCVYSHNVRYICEVPCGGVLPCT